MAEVLHAPSLYDEQSLHTSDSFLRRTSPSNSSPIYIGTPRSYSPPRSSNSSSTEDVNDHLGSQSSSSSPPSPRIGTYISRTPSYHSTAPSSVSFETSVDQDDIDTCWLPTYANETRSNREPSTPPPSAALTESPAPTPDALSTPTDDVEPEDSLPPVADDSAVNEEPSRQVDYLSHEWREEDIWSSWKHIVSKRKVYGERSRLENASWRQWAKQKNHLQTISPETLNWLKDCDVTWLYGPLKEAPFGQRGSEPPSNLSKSNSFLNKKPILKKRSASEVMLQKSISSSSLIKQAAAAVQAQRNSGSGAVTDQQPRLRRSASDFGGHASMHVRAISADLTNTFPSSSSSGMQSPDGSGRRHIRFDNNVEQCIAVDFKPGESVEGASSPSWTQAPSADSEDDDDDDLPMLKAEPKRLTTTPSSSRSSFSQESKGIVKLPSTTLKFHHDDPQCQGHPPSPHSSTFWKQSGTLAQSSSQETLRPSNPSTNFLIEDDDEADMSWEPSGAFGNLKRDSMAIARDNMNESGYDNEDSPRPGLRRTPSGMFMPYDDEEEGFTNTGVLGRLVDTVNTARDIATVVWNVGWRK